MGVRCVIAALLFSGWITGCLGDPPIEDLGSTGGGATTEPVPETRSGSQLDPGFEGYWVGYVENPFERDELGRAVPAVFPSGSTQETSCSTQRDCARAPSPGVATTPLEASSWT